MTNKTSYILARIAGLLVVAFMACVLAVRTPYVQTKLSEKAIEKLSAALNGVIEVDSLSIMPSGALLIKGARLLDPEPYSITNIEANNPSSDSNPTEAKAQIRAKVDTILSVETISATFTFKSLFDGKGIHLGRVYADGVYFHLVSEPTEYLSNLSRVIGVKPPKEHITYVAGGNIFDANRVIVSNFHYKMENFTPIGQHIRSSMQERYLAQIQKRGTMRNKAIDYSDMDLHANLKAHSVRFTGGRIHAIVDDLNAVEKSGYQITKLSGRATVGMGKTLVEDMHLIDPWSNLKIHYYSMTYRSPLSFSKYISDVLMEAEFKSGTLARETLYYYSSFDYGATCTLELTGGHFKGYINDYTVTNLKVRDVTSNLFAIMDCTMVGLPDINQTSIDAKIKDLGFTTRNLGSVINRFTGGNLKLGQFAPKSYFNLNLSAKGPMNRLNYDARINSKDGKIYIKGQIRNIVDLKRDIEISTNLNIPTLNLNKVLSQNDLGNINLNSHLSGKIGAKSQEFEIDSLNIHSFDYRGHSYKDIKLKASYRDLSAALWAESHDPKLDFSISALASSLGGINESSKLSEAGKNNKNSKSSKTVKVGDTQIANNTIPTYRLNADFRNINLSELGLSNSDQITNVQFKINAHLDQVGKFLDGTASIQDMVISDKEAARNIGDSVLDAVVLKGEQKISLNSPILDINLRGSGSIEEFINDLICISVKRELPALSDSATKNCSRNKYKAEILCKDSRNLLAYLVPGLYVADSTKINLQISEDSELSGRLNSSRLALGRSYLKDVVLDFDNRDTSLNAVLNCKELRSNTIRVDNPKLLALAHNNNFGVSLSFDKISDNLQKGELVIDGKISRSETGSLNLDIHPLDSYFHTKNGTWQLHETQIALKDNAISVDSLLLNCGEQSILVAGALSSAQADTLSLRINGVQLSNLSDFIPEHLHLKGRLDGNADIVSDTKLFSGMNSNIILDSLRIADVDGGCIQLSSSMNREEENIALSLRQIIADNTTLRADGAFSTASELIDIDLKIRQLPTKLALPFLSEIFDDIDGSMSGDLRFSGPIKNIAMSSENFRLEDALLRVGFTGVAYTISGPLSLNNTGLHLEQVQVNDHSGGTGILEGSLLFEQFSDFKLNTQFSFDNLKFLDKQNADQNMVYGLIRASGNAKILGPFSELGISADVRTMGNGNIHIPTSGSLTGATSNLLSFTQKAKILDPYEEMLLSYATVEKQSSKINVNANLTANSGLKAFVEIDKAAGNVASFSGNGNINLTLQSAKDIFEINGDYNIAEGDYNFVLPGIISRNFKIQSGSSIKFGGDINNTELDIDTRYKLRTTLSTIVADSTTVGSRRQVDCGIKISDRLSNPKIDFSIDVPDLDPTTRSKIESALGTPDKIQRQFLALLVMGSFIPDESSGVFNGSNVLLSNATELMSNQLNSIFAKLEIPVDVGIGYQTGTEGGRNMFDLAISTQLFNNRVIVGGTVGNRAFGPSTGPAGDVVGDLDIQIKLDPEGKYRFNIFSHSADKYSSYLDFSQRNGVGFSFQRGFSGAKAQKENTEDEKVTISIEADE